MSKHLFKSRSRASIALVLMTCSILTVGFSSFVLTGETSDSATNADQDIYGSKDGSVSADLTNANTEMTLNFEDSLDVDDITPTATNSYYNELFEAKLDYTDSEDHPLADNYELYDPDQPFSAGGGSNPELTETNSGKQFNLENHYLNESQSTFSSWMFAQPSYTAVSATDMSSADSEIAAKINCMPWYTAPPSGYTSEYYIYTASETGQSSYNASSYYRIGATRLVLTSDDTVTYSKYRFYLFFYAMHEEETYLTYYWNGNTYSGYVEDTGWPTVTVSSSSIVTGTKATRYSVVFKVATSSSGTSSVTCYTDDKYFAGDTNAGRDPYIDLIDTSKKNEDFNDTLCRQYVYKFMTSLTTSTAYSCDINSDIYSDTDGLIEDTSRWPFTKTYFARLTYTSGTTVRYRYYRVFNFVYIKGTGKIKMMHSNTNIGIGTGNCYCGDYPTLYINSIDESNTNIASVFNRYCYNTTSSSAFKYVLTYYTQTTSGGTIGTATASAYAKLLDTDTKPYRLDTSLTQDDFDDDQIYSYLKANNTYGKDGGETYTTELIVDYDEVSKYVSGMENYPFVKFAISRRLLSSSSKHYCHYLFMIYKRYSSTNGQNTFVYTGNYISTDEAVATDEADDYWPTYTLYAPGVNNSNIDDSGYAAEASVIYYQRTYYSSAANITNKTLTTNTTNRTLVTNDTYAFADTLAYDADIESTMTSLETEDKMSNAEYAAVTNTEEEEAAETDNYNRHFSNTYSLYWEVDESRDYNFTYYIDNDGYYYFTWTYYRKAYLDKATPTPIKADNQGLFYSYQNPLYDGYQYYASGTALTTDDLDPDVYEYQGYELTQQQQQFSPGVRYIFQNKNDSSDVKKYYFDIASSSTTAKTYTYLTTLTSANKADRLHFVYTVHIKAKTEEAATNIEDWLKEYNFKFSIGINEDPRYGDYYEA